MPDPSAKVKRKNFQKGVDKTLFIWYNNNVRKTLIRKVMILCVLFLV